MLEIRTGFNSPRSTRAGFISWTANDKTWDREPSVGAKSTCEGDSSSESLYSDTERRTFSPADMKHYRSECDSGDDGFFPSDHSEMPSTREPSPEPFWDTAK